MGRVDHQLVVQRKELAGEGALEPPSQEGRQPFAQEVHSRCAPGHEGTAAEDCPGGFALRRHRDRIGGVLGGVAWGVQDAYLKLPKGKGKEGTLFKYQHISKLNPPTRKSIFPRQPEMIFHRI